MPVYEYLCEDCVGVFELLRPVREASADQPCPVCDAGARRLMPTDFAAYILREGMPRRIPDQGKYWTVNGLADEPDSGDGGVDPGLKYASSPMTTSADDDQEEARRRAMLQERQLARATGQAPAVDSRVVDASSTYRQRKLSTIRKKRLLKTAANKDVTARTRSGKHEQPKAPAKKRSAK